MSNLIPIKLAEQAMAVRDEEIARLKTELTNCKAGADFLKAEVERLKNNIAYLDKKLDEELDGGQS